MPVKKGKLKKEDFDRLQKNYKFIIGEIDAKHLVVDMYTNKVFDFDDKEEIETMVRKSARNELFLDKLMYSGPYEAFSVFKSALSDPYPQVLARIESTEIEDSASEPPYSWFNHESEAIKARVITDSDASRVSSAFGKDWRQVVMRLGLRRVQIEREEMNSPHAREGTYITNLLIQWKQKNAREATVEALMNVLMEIEDEGSCTIDWEMLQKAVEKMKDSN